LLTSHVGEKQLELVQLITPTARVTAVNVRS